MRWRILWVFILIVMAAAKASAASTHPAVREALRLLGTPYQLGGTSRRGMDCSAFVQRAYRAAGIKLPRTARAQWRSAQPVRKLLPGDLLFWRDTRGRIDHVAIYVGKGWVAHSTAYYDRAVLEPLRAVNRRARFAGAGRISLENASTVRQALYLIEESVSLIRQRARAIIRKILK